jgi:proteasome lid subunit RPN8/RPN11
MILAENTLKDFEKHVLSCYPEEACGLQVAGKYVPCKNVHETPLTSFKIDPKSIVKAKKIQAILHSHPYHPLDKKVFEFYNDPRWPSVTDQEQFNSGKEPWIIVSTDGTGISEPVIMDDSTWAPLLGREFIWGVQDCYSLLRDYYREHCKITLPNYPREWNWWGKGEDQFMQRFADEGFKRITYDSAEINDICIFKNDSPIANHVGIISGNNEMMQQGVGSLSRISRLDLYIKHVVVWLHYEGKKDAS